MDKFSIVLMNQITGQNHAFEIDSLNYMCTTMLGGTGGHTYIVPALKEICSLLGYSTAGNFTIELLNTICTGGGGTGGHTYEYEAWYEIQQGSLLNQTILLERNKDIVEIAGYQPVLDSGTQLSNASPGRYFMNQNNLNKIRSNGTLTKIKQYFNPTGTEWWIQIWRKIEGVYTIVYEEDIYSKIIAAGSTGIREITLADTVNVLEGDYISTGQVSTSTNISVYGTAVSAADSLPFFAGAKPTTGYDWDTIAGIQFNVPIKAYGQAPMMVVIGDSIAAGHPAHYSYVEDSKVDVKANQIAYQMQVLDANYSYQNMGIGGNSTDMIAGNIAPRCTDLKPKLCVINGGVNDLAQSKTKAYFLQYWTISLNALAAAGIGIVALKILPWTAGSNELMAERDLWNADLAALVATYENAICIDFDVLIGQNRVSGAEGNLWDIKTAYNYGDGVHLNLAGYTAMAAKIDEEIKKVYRFV